MDYIFIIGPSAVGKTTLAKELYAHYKGVYFEMNVVPEFCIPEGVPDIGVYEEQLCWENVLLQLKFFHEKGFRNIVALDFDDIRARELPLLFRGSDFLILRLISSDPTQIRRQMEYRNAHEGGLYTPDYVERANEVIRARALLPNEVMLDIAGKTKEEVFAQAVGIIDRFTPLREYDYVPGDEKAYLSWVQSRGLF